MDEKSVRMPRDEDVGAKNGAKTRNLLESSNIISCFSSPSSSSPSFLSFCRISLSLFSSFAFTFTHFLSVDATSLPLIFVFCFRLSMQEAEGNVLSCLPASNSSLCFQDDLTRACEQITSHNDLSGTRQTGRQLNSCERLAGKEGAKKFVTVTVVVLKFRGRNECHLI